MKEISLTQFKLKKVPEITSGECMKVTADGEMVGYFIVNPESVMKDRIEAFADLIDKSRGF